MNAFEKNGFFRTAAAILTLVLVFSVCEIVIRVYNKTQNRDRQIWIPDPYLGAVHAPDNRFLYDTDNNEEFSVWHQTNSLGLIGGEVSVRKPAGTTRVVVLGDSFTEALQVADHESFCALLQEYLNSQENFSGKNYEILNAGVSGYSPISEYLYLRRELLRLEPDVIMVQLFANDVFEDHKTRAMSLMDTKGLPVRISRYFLKEYKNLSPVPAKNTTEKSFFEKVLKAAVNSSRYIEYIYVRAVKAKKNSAYNKELMELGPFVDRERFFIVQDESPFFQDGTFRGVAWRNTERYLSAIKDLAQEHGARLILFYIPLKNQLGLMDYGEDVPSELMRSANTYFNQLLKNFSEHRSLEFLDMLPVFELNKDEELYYRQDGHLTPQGHRLVAHELLNFFKMDDAQEF